MPRAAESRLDQCLRASKAEPRDSLSVTTRSFEMLSLMASDEGEKERVKTEKFPFHSVAPAPMSESAAEDGEIRHPQFDFIPL